MWLFPLDKEMLGPTRDSDSFRSINPEREVEIPQLPHVGAFRARRRQRLHEGVDLYGMEGDRIYAVEHGVVVGIEWFTGEKAKAANCGRWADTMAVLVEGPTGVVCYGELMPEPQLTVGTRIERGRQIGMMLRVYARENNRPRDMLHLELYTPGQTVSCDWHEHASQIELPESLLDPTPFLLTADPR